MLSETVRGDWSVFMVLILEVRLQPMWDLWVTCIYYNRQSMDHGEKSIKNLVGNCTGLDNFFGGLH